MFDFVKKFNWKKTGIFAAGVLFGTAGIKILGSKYAEAQQINEDRAAKAAEYTDESVEDATEETVAE